ncbi:MAG: CoB--CoM heterodisulfide reductase iron-sulfur subunit A family protein [Bacteroidales bacterium]|nr:CoB--CoM heterodisulfide reductase iron-sulfur subunit A family protein [Bacteroidales bacterium]
MKELNDAVIIGGGIAGLQCANILARRGRKVVVVERADTIGGHVAQWHTCYPFGLTGKELVDKLTTHLELAEIITNAEVDNIERERDKYAVTVNGKRHDTRTVLIATGYNLFDAHIKEELGYGVYPRVITSVELENAWNNNTMPFDTSDTDAPRFAIVHCVGSRDLKCNVTHCSKVCCMAGIKAAKELKQHYPTCQVTNYYMDLRMFDTSYEELYHNAQTEFNVQFVRGRISEISLGNKGRLKLKSEDTLLGIPIVDRVHGVVLMIGMQPPATIKVDNEDLAKNQNGFLLQSDPINANLTEHPGIFIAGACKGPKTITETLADAKAVALAIDEYVTK